MSDEELDALFRRGAEGYPDEVPLGAWLRMEDKLAKAALQQQVRQQTWRQVKRLFALEIGVVLLALLLWYSFRLGPPAAATVPKPDEPKSSLGADNHPPLAVAVPSARAVKKPVSTSAQPIPAQGNTALPVASGKGKSFLPTAQPKVSLIQIQAAESGKGAPRIVLPVAPSTRHNVARRQREEVGLSSLAFASGRLRKVYTVENQNILSGSARKANTAAIEPATAAVANVDKSHIPQSKAGPTLAGVENTTTEAEAAAPASVLSDSAATAAAWPPVSTAATDSAATKRPHARPPFRLLIGVVGAPEVSAVRLNELTRPGGSVGVVVEYQLAPRWRVRTGLLRSVKLYAARGTDYTPPPYYWTWSTPVESIDANCRILEIPLDLRYDVLQRPTYSVFASVGLTSLLMRNEQYTYHYEYGGYYMRRTWELARGGNQPFSMLNLSMGYERAVAGRWALQAEPFLKLPLAGVGFGKIHLRSAGVLFGAKYHLLRARAASPLP